MYTVYAPYYVYLQVFSESVAKALTFSGDSSVEETARFVELMDKMFDCLKVHNFSHASKPFQLPYRSPKDVRHQVITTIVPNYTNVMQCVIKLFIQWLRDVFLKYLDDWETSVNERPGFTKEQKNLMLLSPATRLGLRMTGTTINLTSFGFHYIITLCSAVLAFIELVEYVFILPDVSDFLSQRISQDPLENFFGCQ